MFGSMDTCARCKAAAAVVLMVTWCQLVTAYSVKLVVVNREVNQCKCTKSRYVRTVAVPR